MVGGCSVCPFSLFFSCGAFLPPWVLGLLLLEYLRFSASPPFCWGLGVAPPYFLNIAENGGLLSPKRRGGVLVAKSSKKFHKVAKVGLWGERGAGRWFIMGGSKK